MRPLFNHSLITSFALHLDHVLLDGAQAYTNVSTGLYRMVDPSVRGNVWASPFKSWVSDSCVSGAAVPSGVYNSSGQFLTRASGIVIDFINGRVISPDNWGSQLSGTFAKKDFNVYTSTEDDVSWYMEQVYSENKDISYLLTGIAATPLVAPCVILTNSKDENEPWALGGTMQTLNTINGYVICNSAYLQEGISSYTRDMAETSFPLVTYTDAPWNNSGDLKTGYYCYNDLCARYGPAGVYIAGVHNTKVNQRVNKATTFKVSMLEFDLNTVRMAHGNR